LCECVCVCVFCVCVCTCTRTSHMQAPHHHWHNLPNVKSLLNFSKGNRTAIFYSELRMALVFQKIILWIHRSEAIQFNNFSTISSTAISCSKWRSALTFQKIYLLAAMPSSSPRIIRWFRATASWDMTIMWKEMYLHEIRRLDTETDIERMRSFRAVTIQNWSEDRRIYGKRHSIKRDV